MSNNGARQVTVVWMAVMTLWLSGPAQAATGYVTDMLQLDLYASEAMTGRAVRKLRSGDSFEILSRKGRAANVRLSDGQTGWVKSLYIVEKEPARTRLNKLESENESLLARLEALGTELELRSERIAALEGDEGSAIVQLEAAQTELQDLRERNASLETSLSRYSSSVPVSWLLVLSFLALVAGAAGGWYYVDSRSRARHGGYRIY